MAADRTVWYVDPLNEAGMEKQRALVGLAALAKSCEDNVAGKMHILEDMSRTRLIHVSEQLNIELKYSLDGTCYLTRSEIIDEMISHTCTAADVAEYLG